MLLVIGWRNAVLLEGVKDTYNFFNFLIGQDLADGNAEFLLVNLFGNGQVHSVPLFITLLLVWWNGVVDEGLYAPRRQVLLQAVAFRAKDGEDVIDVVRVGHLAGECDERIADMLVVVAGNLLASAVVGIQVAKLDIKDSSLDFIEAAVAPLVSEDVFTL